MKLSNFELKLPLAKAALDRDYLLRVDPNWFENLAKNTNTSVLVMNRERVLLNNDSGLRYHEPEFARDSELIAYLGRDTESNRQIVLAVIDDARAFELEPEVSNWHGLRKSGIGLSPIDAAVFTSALALANWHATHRYCPACGSPTEVIRAGWVRTCLNDGRELFPRTDPAIIVAITDEEDRILLGSQGAWEENRFSILAGFVEPGESLTAAVVREMQEEAGVLVGEVEYLGSQAWPFPYSLMLGFTAKYRGGVPTPDGEEIVKLRWFSRSELIAEADSLLLPGRLSIARAIIEHWLGEELNSGE